jgi:signal transduction histidine kinase
MPLGPVGGTRRKARKPVISTDSCEASDADSNSGPSAYPAIANAEARNELAASRARIAAAADDERRRVVRDLHDGAQQRLVITIMTLNLARSALQNEEEDLP